MITDIIRKSQKITSDWLAHGFMERIKQVQNLSGGKDE